MDQKKRLACQAYSLGEFIEKYGKTGLYVPPYQRHYVWSLKKNAYVLSKFISDIYQQFRKDPESYYDIGNIAVCRSETNYLVDGQQRFTTLMIFLYCVACKCGREKDAEKLFYKSGTFFLQEDSYLTKDIEYYLLERGEPSNDKDSNIIDAVQKIRGFVRMERAIVGDLASDFYDYLLDEVQFSCKELVTQASAMHYFMTINGLSVPLEENELFDSAVSMMMKASGFKGESEISYRASLDEISQKIKGFSGEDANEVFLKTYYAGDPNIYLLGDKTKEGGCGIGRWVAGYKPSLLDGKEDAVDFLRANKAMRNDIQKILSSMLGISTEKGANSSDAVIFGYIMKMTKYKLLKPCLVSLFTSRNDYSDNGPTFHENQKDQFSPINYDVVDGFFRLAWLSLVKSAINGDGTFYFDDETFAKDTVKGNKAITVINGIATANLFGLRYAPECVTPSAKPFIAQKELITTIFALEEAYLHKVADGSDPASLLESLLDPKSFTIEHLHSINEYNDSSRRKEWVANVDEKYGVSYWFDSTRNGFVNLSLIDQNSNSEAGPREMVKKRNVYLSANKVSEVKPEYLVQSFVTGSPFYKSDAITALKLPNRAIKISDSDKETWTIDEDANKKFNEDLLLMALKGVANA
jgi:hypothetical protein